MMTQIDPNISVVIPCFNAGPYLRDCLNSVLTQTLPPIEVIVVNDGSTDQSPQILAEYGDKIIAINQQNRGVSRARNVGMGLCQGDWIAIQDADDIWEPTKLKKQWITIQKAKNDPICCYTDFFTFGDGLSTTKYSQPELFDARFPIAEMLANWSVTSNSAMFKSQFKNRVQFPEEVADGEDDIFFALLRKEGHFIKTREFLSGYRIHPGQKTSEKWHAFNKIAAKLKWLEKNSILNSEETLIFTAEINRQVNQFYESAYWQRDWELAKAFQKLHRKYLVPFLKQKQFIDKFLPPKFIISFKDSLYSFLKKS